LSGGLLGKPHITSVVFWRTQNVSSGERSEHAASLLAGDPLPTFDIMKKKYNDIIITYFI